jgi:hypothetical protein
MIRNHGGIIILVERPNNPIKVQHVSELGIKKENVDYIIQNDDTIESFYNKIKSDLNFLYNDSVANKN